MKILFKHFAFILLLAVSTLTVAQASRADRLSIAKADSLFFAADYKAAAAMYSMILSDTSRNAGAWSRYGFSNLSLKNYAEAIRLFEKALANKPPRGVKANSLASMGRAYAATKNNEKALIRLDSAVALGYANISILDTNDDFINIRDNQKFKSIRQRAYATAYPCMANPQARQFDFWIGEWTVYTTGTKTIAGNSKVEMVSRGCALLENWDNNASSGKSLNFVDPLTGKWRQTWVGSGNIQDFVDGEYKDGAMHFVFKARGQQGIAVMGRFIFFNEKPGQVRQLNETSRDGGMTWSMNYDFTYVKNK